MKSFSLTSMLLAAVILFLTPPVLYAGRRYDLRPLQDPANQIWIKRRVPSRTIIRRYKNNPEFKYNKTIIPPVTLWDEIRLMLMRQIKKLFILGGEFNIWTSLVYIISGTALIYVIIKLFKSEIHGIFFWKKKSRPEEGISIAEGIKDNNYSAIIQEALIHGDYREVIRIFYNWTLSRLFDKKLIESTQEKTNFDYARELSDTKYAADFYELTRIFEYTWYGDFTPAENEFILIKKFFTNFINELG